MEQTWSPNVPSSSICSISQNTFRLYPTIHQKFFWNQWCFRFKITNTSFSEEHEFKHNLQNTLNLLCPCTLKAEDTYHLSSYLSRIFFFDDLNAITLDILKIRDNDVLLVLLFGSKGFTRDMNLQLLNLQLKIRWAPCV